MRTKKRINIFRKNEYVGYINNLDILVNNRKYNLPVNSSIKVDTYDENLEIVVKYLWVKSKVLLNDQENTFNIRVRPLISDNILILSISFLIFLFVLQYFIEYVILEFFFKLIGISFLLIFFFLSTIGSRYFYKIEIN